MSDNIKFQFDQFTQIFGRFHKIKSVMNSSQF
jgi:hypothetical protein